MNNPHKSSQAMKKRKRKANVSTSEPKNMKLNFELLTTKQRPELNKKEVENTEKVKIINKSPVRRGMTQSNVVLALEDRYPVFNNQELVKRFLNVPMTNNQKGRIRQLLKDNLKGMSQVLLPDIIHSRIQDVLKSAIFLTDADLRKLRILYNMLKTALAAEQKQCDDETKKQNNKDLVKERISKEKPKVLTEDVKKESKENKLEQKVKGPKRYVVFVGNLPLDITKEKLTEHFGALSIYIKDVRLPKRNEGKKSAIAYIELASEPSYQLALSKHHSMLDNKRINVLYTTQKNGKITKSVAKGKTAKLVALQKAGQLIGSVPMNRKRSQRRKKMKEALAKQSSE